MTTFLILGLLLGLIIIGMPIALSLGVTSLVSMVMLFGMDAPVDLVAQRMYYGVNSFLLVAVPFFMLAGEIMNRSGATTRLFSFADALVGYLPGGLGHVNVASSLIFAGMSGSAAADAAGLGAIEIKAMKERGFPLPFSVGLTAASSTVGPMVPPSIPMIVFGVVSGTSIGGLFLAGVLPGFLMCVLLSVTVWIWGSRKGAPRSTFSTSRLFQSLKGAFLPLMTPVIVLSGIFGGLFTPTEASVVAVIYTSVLGVFVYKEINVNDLIEIMKKVAREIAPLMLIVATASLFGYLIIRLGLPRQLSELILSSTSDPTAILFLIAFILLMVGFFMETVSAIIIFTPLFMPVITAAGISPLQLGVVMVITLMVGVITPPVGIVLFILERVSGLPIEKVFKAVLPFFIPLTASIIILIVFPEVSTWLPKLFYGYL
ncbi:TRAP transporter large permease [Vibrio penaeicida]|uniref:TRAP transporter large permease n=1 Tax=Vibrio penaeicida TaxID=104609 RepID=UPI002732D173|nr:TRAP transporter large permease [Vibrio penaeicida]MDP2571383.1 TRAP transporter large permease [Vibrio penaeicida]